MVAILKIYVELDSHVNVAIGQFLHITLDFKITGFIFLAFAYGVSQINAIGLIEKYDSQF